MRWTEDKTDTLVAASRPARWTRRCWRWRRTSAISSASRSRAIRSCWRRRARTRWRARSAAGQAGASCAAPTVLLLDDGHCLRDQALAVCAGARIDELDFRATSLPTLAQMVAGRAPA